MQPACGGSRPTSLVSVQGNLAPVMEIDRGRRANGSRVDARPRHIVNCELPMVASDCVHRIGRTGRAGIDGDAISLVCVDEQPLLADIERLLGHRVEVEVIPGFEPDRSIRPQSIQLRSGEGRHQNRPLGRGQQPNRAARESRPPQRFNRGRRQSAPSHASAQARRIRAQSAARPPSPENASRALPSGWRTTLPRSPRPCAPRRRPGPRPSPVQAH